jgi:hypothetical protein
MDICSTLERIALNISLTKQQHDVTHTIRQTEILDLLSSRVTSTPSVKMLCGQKNCLSVKNTACWSVVLLGFGRIVSVCCKTVCRWVTANCCFMSEMSERKTFQTNFSGTSETAIFFQISLYFCHNLCRVRDTYARVSRSAGIGTLCLRFLPCFTFLLLHWGLGWRSG